MVAIPENLTFEQALSRLNEIVSSLESGSVNLEEAVKFYEEGMALKEFCHKQLEKAKIAIAKIDSSINAGEEAK